MRDEEEHILLDIIENSIRLAILRVGFAEADYIVDRGLNAASLEVVVNLHSFREDGHELGHVKSLKHVHNIHDI